MIEKTVKNGSEEYKRTYNELSDFHIGDKVIIKCSTIGIPNVPRMLELSPMTVVGFGRKNVICDYDGGKPYSVPPELLAIIGE